MNTAKNKKIGDRAFFRGERKIYSWLLAFKTNDGYPVTHSVYIFFYLPLPPLLQSTLISTLCLTLPPPLLLPLCLHSSPLPTSSFHSLSPSPFLYLSPSSHSLSVFFCPSFFSLPPFFPSSSCMESNVFSCEMVYWIQNILNKNFSLLLHTIYYQS